MSTYQGCGTNYLGFSARDSKGCNYATKWFVLFNLPIIPFARYYLEIGDVTSSSLGATFSTTRYYTIYHKTRINFLEILATYFYIYIVLPLCAFVPAGYLSSCVKEYSLPD